MASSMSPVPRPFMTAFAAQRPNPFRLLERRLWRHREFVPIGDHVYEGRPWMRQRRLDRGCEIGGVLDTRRVHAHRRRHRSKIRVLQPDAEIEEAGRHHLELDEAERAVVEDDDLHRQIVLNEREEIAHQHRKAAVARQRDHLARRKCRLHADRLRHGVGHRAVTKRAEHAALAVHLQVARRPDRRCADIEGEDRVLRCEVADRLGNELRMDRLVAGLPGRQFVQILACLAVVGEAVIEMRAVALGLEPRQQPLDRGANVGEDSEIEPAATPEVFRPDVDLGDLCVIGEELAIREIGAEHQKHVRVHHRVIAGREADEPGHADIVGVVPFDVLLAAQRVDDRRLQGLGEGKDLRMRAGAAAAAKQRHALGVEERRKRLDVGLRRIKRAARRQQALARCRLRLGRQHRDIARQHDDRDAAFADGRAYRGIQGPRHLRRRGDELAIV